MIYKALSLWQPHAQAISLGLKPYETRGWYTGYRGPLAIHAAKKKFNFKDYPGAYFQEVSRQFKEAGCPVWALDYGKVICIVDVVDCVPVGVLRGKISRTTEFWGNFNDFGDDEKPRYAMKLENLRLIDANKRPAVTGRQGFFSVNLAEEIF